jgi:hypothetical protein
MESWLAKSLLCVAVLFAADASATLQQHDTIAIGDKTAELRVYPLASWIALHPDAIPDEVYATNRMRGYVAHWMLVDGRLELARVDVEFVGPTKLLRLWTATDIEEEGTYAISDVPTFVDRDVMPTMFPGQARVVADWYSGTLVIQQGRLTDDVGYANSMLYERYTLVIIERGRETKRLPLDAAGYDRYRVARFKRFQQTPAYDAAIRELADLSWSEPDAIAAVYADRLEDYISLDPVAG